MNRHAAWLLRMLTVVVAGCGGASHGPERPAPASPAPTLSELEQRTSCRWRSLPTRIYFDCDSADPEAAQALSRGRLEEVLALIETDASIRGAKVLGYYSATQEPHRDDLALARARALAELLRQRTGLPVVAEAFGAAPSTTYPEPCVRTGPPEDRRGAERFATFGVLRCGETPASPLPVRTATGADVDGDGR